MISPLLLRAQVSPPAGGGAFGLADTTLLENPFQGPMWLDEIRFRLPGGTQGQAWANLWVELKLGELPLTKGFVPIGLFGKVLSDSTIVGENGVAANYSPNVFTWKLPKPLYIPARELLRPTFYYDPYSAGEGGAPARTITVIYACRPVERGTPPPATMAIPWVTFFKPPVITGITDGDRTDQSTPADLYNPHDEELHVQRFIGRLMVQDFGEDSYAMELASALVNLSTGEVTCGTLVSAQDSFNNILIRDRTPFAHVFDFLDRAWTVNCILPPKGFYLFTVDRLWAEALSTVVATVGISMVGWREVRVRR